MLELIGRGGMGAVYKARHRGLDRMLALKVLPPGGSDSSFAERFSREARTQAKLSHPHIVAIYDFGQVEELSYILMEFVDGPNLRQAIRLGSLSPLEVFGIIVPICEALQFAHDEGIIHRDIKPENLLVDPKGRIKIADFGLAKLLAPSAADPALTALQQVLGTLHYMAPEQIEEPQAVDQRADIYSLGVVFYEMLTGKLPLGRFPAPSHKVAVDARTDEVIFKALEKEPDRRYQQISEMCAAVRKIMGGT